MPQIVLTEEQARIVAEAGGPVDVRDAQGQPLASLTPLSAEDLRAIEHFKRNRDKQGPGIPSYRVQAFLQKLHEMDASEGVTPEKVEELLRRVSAGEPL